MKYLQKMNKVLFFLSVLGVSSIGFSQQTDSIAIPDTNLEPPEMIVENTDIKKDSTNNLSELNLTVSQR